MITTKFKAMMIIMKMVTIISRALSRKIVPGQSGSPRGREAERKQVREICQKDALSKSWQVGGSDVCTWSPSSP